LKLQYDQPLSNCAFSFNLRRYNVVVNRANRLEGEAGLVLSERDVVALLESILCEFNTPGVRRCRFKRRSPS